MVKRFWALGAAIFMIAASTACKRGIYEQEAVRQGVIDYLSKRSNLNVSGMNVSVTSVTFRFTLWPRMPTKVGSDGGMG